MTLLQTSLIGCAVLMGLAGGATFAFSNFVMQALRRLPEADAIAAMRAINETAINPLFMVLLIGSGVIALVIAGLHLAYGQPAPGGPRVWLLVGTATYVLGVIVVTAGGNVPLNETLARGNTLTWADYERPWLAWNHLRTVAAAVATAAFARAATLA